MLATLSLSLCLRGLMVEDDFRIPLPCCGVTYNYWDHEKWWRSYPMTLMWWCFSRTGLDFWSENSWSNPNWLYMAMVTLFCVIPCWSIARAWSSGWKPKIWPLMVGSSDGCAWESFPHRRLCCWRTFLIILVTSRDGWCGDGRCRLFFTVFIASEFFLTPTRYSFNFVWLCYLPVWFFVCARWCWLCASY